MSTQTTAQSVVLNSEVVSPDTTRVITIVPSSGQKTKVSFTGNTWEQLKSQLQSGGTDINGQRYTGFSFNNIKAIESTRKNTLDNPNAVVPGVDFVLFLFPEKTKSGATTKKAAPKKATAKKAPAKKAPAKKAAAKAAPKKVATKKAAPKKATPVKKVSAPKAKAIAKVVKSVADSKPVVSEQEENDILNQMQKDLRLSTPGIKQY